MIGQGLWAKVSNTELLYQVLLLSVVSFELASPRLHA